MNELTALQAHPDASGQAESRTAFSRLKENAEARRQPWWIEFEELLDVGWEWRKAVLIAWQAAPLKDRWPVSQEKLAELCLGLRSDRAIQKWRKADPEIERTVAMMQAAPLLRHRREIYEALVASATNPDPRCHPDRRLSLEMMGDYMPRTKAQVDVEGEIGLLSVDEWREAQARRQAEIAETVAAFAGDASGASA